MHKSRPVTERIQYMRDLIRDRVIRNDAERAVIITEAYKKYQHVLPVIKKPLAMLEYCKKKKVRVEDFEVIVGNRGEHFLGNTYLVEWHGVFLEPFTNPDFPGAWHLGEDGLYHNPESDMVRLTISPEDVEKLKSIKDYWDENVLTRIADAWQPDGYDELCRLNVCKNVPGSPLIMMQSGHISPGYKKIINTGIGAIRKQAQDWIDEHNGNLMGDKVKKYLFYKSVVITCDAISIMIKRYGEECYRKLEECQDEKRKAELKMMGDGLMWISENPARTFWEALQLTIMYQLYLFSETSFPGPAFGRIDQYTWPFLKADLEAGRIDLDTAQEYLDAFFLKANCFYAGGTGKLAETTGIGNTYQHTTIGGVDPKTGADATNPVTYMVLDTMRRLRLHDPTISLRINKNTSLTAIKYMVFEKKLCTAREMYDAIMANWEGYEELRQTIINEVPHFGNADPYADEMMKWVCDTYYEICKKCYSERASVYKAGLYSAADHIAQGYTTWATPDGRRTGEPIADAASPVQGRDRNGPTAVCISATCYDHKKFVNGVCLNLRIHPSALNGEDGKQKLRQLTQAYFNRGGLEIQYNIVDAETMRAAQKDPESYRDLVVRIAGYSAYFVELGRDGQDDLIRRTENSL